MANILRSSGRIKPDTVFPFTVINKLGTVVTDYTSCGSRQEESLYEFVTYTRQRKQLNRIIERIRDRYDTVTLGVTNRRIMGTLWSGGSISEIETGLFCGKIQYQVFAEKDVTERTNFSLVTGDNFLECLKNRYLESQRLQLKVNGFYTSNFGGEETDWPYITVGEIRYSADQRHSCGIVDEAINFPFQVWGKSAERVEIIKEIIMDEYDAITMSLSDRTFYSMLYQGDTLLELESGIWLGEVEYQLIQGKAI